MAGDIAGRGWLLAKQFGAFYEFTAKPPWPECGAWVERIEKKVLAGEDVRRNVIDINSCLC